MPVTGGITRKKSHMHSPAAKPPNRSHVMTTNAGTLRTSRPKSPVAVVKKMWKKWGWILGFAPPKNQHVRPLKIDDWKMLEDYLFFWNGRFLGDMLVFGGVAGAAETPFQTRETTRPFFFPLHWYMAHILTRHLTHFSCVLFVSRHLNDKI